MSKKIERNIFGMEVKLQIDETVKIDEKDVKIHEGIKISQGNGYVRLTPLHLAGLYQLQKDKEFNDELVERLNIQKAKVSAL